MKGIIKALVVGGMVVFGFVGFMALLTMLEYPELVAGAVVTVMMFVGLLYVIGVVLMKLYAWIH